MGAGPRPESGLRALSRAVGGVVAASLQMGGREGAGAGGAAEEVARFFVCKVGCSENLHCLRLLCY